MTIRKQKEMKFSRIKQLNILRFIANNNLQVTY